MKILVVDDEKLIRDVIREYATNEGYTVFEAENGQQALEIIEKEKISLVLLDVMMPLLDGFSTCKEIKKIKDIPIIILSARIQELDKLYGFDLGIDDYITKPFSPKEVMARIKAVLNRSQKVEDIYTYEDLTVDFKSRFVTVDGKEIFLTPKQYDLLHYFIQNKNMALTREQILNQVWGYDFYGDDRTIDSHIKILRNSLGKYRDLIVTVRAVGYKFAPKE